MPMLTEEERLQRKWDENPFPLLYHHFKGMLNSIKGEPEFEIFFKDIPNTYMIIKYYNQVSIQRCSGNNPGSEEIFYNSLDELYEAHSIDGICLKELWEEITDITVNGTFSAKYDSKEIRDIYHIPDSVLCAEKPRVCPIINKVVFELDCYEFIVGCTDTPQFKYYSKWNHTEMHVICDRCVYNAYDC